MKKITYTQIFNLVVLMVALFIVSCSQLDGPNPLESNTIPPGIVSNVQIENLKGKVDLKYTLPSDEDLLYVKAVYKLENGTEMVVKSSYYNNNMTIVGFLGGAGPIKVNLYSVNRSETESSPLEITVNPQKSPIFDVFNSLSIQDDFGGLRINAENATKADIAILVMKKNDFGDFEPLPKSIYTSSEIIKQSIRGLDTIPVKIAVVVQDRWKNVTDTIIQTIKPLYESVLPRNKYNGLKLDNDPDHYEEFCCNKIPLSALWDQNFFWPGSIVTARDAPNTKLNTITFDIGQSAKISRIHIWDYPEDGSKYFYLESLRYFRIWGTNNLPDQSGNLSNWTLLGDYEVTKPSGLPYTILNNDDVAQATAGVSYDFPLGVAKMRYIRIESIENWGKVKGLAISELLVYGDNRK
ncbi:MAG: DUF4959 domain-containing protein [Flavobacterium sp.]